MTILVTGGAGYIGSHTCLELIQAGHEVLVVDNLANSDRQALHRVGELTGVEPALVEADLRDAEAIDRLFASHDIEAVIHFAGLKAVGESVAEPLRYYHNNGYGTQVLCRTMAGHGGVQLVCR